MSTRMCLVSQFPIRTQIGYMKVRNQAANSFSAVKSSKYLGTRQFSRVKRASPAPEIVESLKKDGCVVIESMFTPSQVAYLNKDLDAALANVSPGKPANTNATPLPGGADAEVFGRNTKRLGCLPALSAAFREIIIDDDALHNISAEIFKETGDYWLSTAQMIEMGPGSKAQPLHADASGWWPFWSMGGTWNPEFAVNFLIATTDTTRMNGATGVVPDSHKIKYQDVIDDATLGFWQFPDERVEQIELKAGDCLLLGGRIVHRGEDNKTTDDFRRVLSCTVISASLTPEEAHPLSLGGGKAKNLSERAKKFLGFRELATIVGPDVWQDHRRGGLKKALGF
ncbi:Dioxygenase FUM3 [Paramyrothecium foliicola]|nr:Dioxygenase FUM3 [Paramyrothecium foliicola]